MSAITRYRVFTGVVGAGVVFGGWYRSDGLSWLVAANGGYLLAMFFESFKRYRGDWTA